MKISIDKIDLFIFDFDGVLTNNLVHLDQHGIESVVCNRSDGLAFDTLRKLKKKIYILSSERNLVVSSRAEKLHVPVIQGVGNKYNAIKQIITSENCSLENVIYMGNDLNDYAAMKICGISVCPADSHPKILKISNYVLKKTGGDGVVRELVEDLLCLDVLEILYGSEI